MDMRKYSRRSAYIKTDDVRDGPRDETIAFVKEGRFGKPDVSFESGRVLSINATNTGILIGAYGSNSDGWIGKQVRLFLGAIKYQGQDNEAVLIKPLSKRAESAPDNGRPFDDSDSIPF